jgi:hypothetical protein
MFRKGRLSVEADKSTYPSLDFLLELAQQEYKYEDERGKIFDTRSGFCLAFIAACLTFFASMVNNLDRIMKIMFLESWWGCGLLGGAIICLVVGLVAFVKALSAREYQRINVKECEEFIGYPIEKYKKNILDKLITYIDVNAKQNDIKANYCQRGLISIVMAMAFCILILIIKFLN